VQLAPRFGDVAAGLEDDLAITGPETDRALGDDRVLVLLRVQVWRHESAHGEGVLDDRDEPVRLLAEELEDDADRTEGPLTAVPWLDNRQLRGLDIWHVTPLLRGNHSEWGYTDVH
jgi:hypothetical protein